MTVELDPDAYSLLFPADDAVEGSDPYDYWQCRLSSGIPMSGVLYPFLSPPDTVTTRAVVVGGQTYTATVGVAEWTYQECGPEPYCLVNRRTEVRSTLAAGIGQVALEATYSVTDTGTPVRRDTLRARLVGAEVGGVVYGQIEPVATADGPEHRPLALRVGPNPARGTATAFVALDAPARAELAVFDALGRRVRTEEVAASGSVALDLSDQPAGVYLVRLVADGAVATARIVVVR